GVRSPELEALRIEPAFLVAGDKLVGFKTLGVVSPFGPPRRSAQARWWIDLSKLGEKRLKMLPMDDSIPERARPVCADDLLDYPAAELIAAPGNCCERGGVQIRLNFNN